MTPYMTGHFDEPDLPWPDTDLIEPLTRWLQKRRSGGAPRAAA